MRSPSNSSPKRDSWCWCQGLSFSDGARVERSAFWSTCCSSVRVSLLTARSAVVRGVSASSARRFRADASGHQRRVGSRDPNSRGISDRTLPCCVGNRRIYEHHAHDVAGAVDLSARGTAEPTELSRTPSVEMMFRVTADDAMTPPASAVKWRTGSPADADSWQAPLRNRSSPLDTGRRLLRTHDLDALLHQTSATEDV